MADAKGTAGSVIKGSAGLWNLVPFVGGAISTLATVGGGMLEQSAAKDQAEQAANLRKKTDAMQPGQLQGEYWKKYSGDQAMALGGLPGIDLYKDWLAQNMATNMRGIKENSPNGAAAVNAISLALGGENAAVSKLGINDAEYRAKYTDAALDDLWSIGDKKQGLVDDVNKRKALGYSQANNLEAAATGNKQTGWNTILGAIGSTATELTKNFETDMWDKSMATDTASPVYPAAPGTELTNFNPSEYSMWNYQPNFSPSYTTPPQ